MTVKVQNYLEEQIAWKRGPDAEHPYEGELEGARLAIRINDFPDESLYTLLVNDVEIANFDDWPKPWIRPKA